MPDNQDYRLYLESKFEGIAKHINAQFQIVHDRLEGIEEQTKRTNGTVIKHEEIITKNLPHTIVHCSQTESINQIKEAVLSEKITKKEQSIADNLKKKGESESWQRAVWIVMGVIAIASIWVNIWLNNKKGDQIEAKVKNLGEPIIVNQRGQTIQLPTGFSLKMYPNDLLKDSIR